MFEDFEQLRIAVNDVGIACVAAGKGETLLMRHGFSQTMALWARIAPAAPDRHRAQANNLRHQMIAAMTKTPRSSAANQHRCGSFKRLRKRLI